MLTPEQLADLREKAQAATPGPWKADLRVGKAMVYPSKYNPNCSCDVPDEDMVCTIHGVYRDDAWHMEKQQDDNARYIAAANPTTILQLLDMVTRLEKEADWLAEQCENIEVELYAITDPNTIDHISSSMSKSPSEWREAARKAVEESQ